MNSSLKDSYKSRYVSFLKLAAKANKKRGREGMGENLLSRGTTPP